MCFLFFLIINLSFYFVTKEMIKKVTWLVVEEVFNQWKRVKLIKQ